MKERKHVDEKEIIRLFIEEQQNFSFIGKQLGISKGTVQRRLISNNIELSIPKICPSCNTEFISHNGMQKYCSKECTNIVRNNNRNKFTRDELSNSPNRKCLVCGSEFEVNSKTITKKYCSNDCQNKAERIFGNKAKHDIEYHDKIKFDGNRAKVLIRDNYECQICGKKSQLIVHHKDFTGKTNSTIDQQNDVNNDIDNLITLCRKCHINLHRIL